MADIANLVIKVASTDVAKAKEALRGLGTQAKTSEREVSGAASGMATALRGAAAAFVSFQSAATFVKVADQMTNLESRIKLTMSATEDYTKVQRELLAVANSSRVALQDIGTLYARIAPSVKQLGGTQREAIGITNALSKALLIGGASTAEASSAIIQFSQAMASGVLRGEEFNAISEAAPPIMDALARQLGVTRGELRAMAADGKLTADVVGNALLNSVTELEQRAAQMAPTVSGAMQVLRNELDLVVEQFNKGTGATAGMSAAVTDATKSVTDLASAFRTGNFSEQQQIALGIAGAVGGVAAAYVGVRTVLGTVTLAQLAFNAAVRANPLIIGLSIVTAGVAAIYGYEKAQRATITTTQSLTDAEKKLADLRARANSGSPSVAGAATPLLASAEKRVKILKDQIAAEQNAEQLRIIRESEKEVAADKLASKTAKNASGYVQLGRTGAAAATEIGKAAKKAADDAANLAKQLNDAKVALQSALDDRELMAGGLSSEIVGMLNNPLATAGNIGQQNAIEQAAIDQDKLTEATKRTEEAAKAADAAYTAYLEKDFGSNLAAGFDGASAALGSFVSAFEKMTDMQAKYNEAIKAAGGDEKKVAKLRAKNATDQIGAFGDITGAAKGFFKEGSKGYKALGAAEKVFRAFELAQSLQVTAAKILGYEATAAAAVASVGPTVAAETAKGTAAAATAVATQGAGDPYTAFPRIAAMIALMAAIGFAVGGGGDSGPGFTDNTGTGTVLGDPTAQSESIAKSIELLGEAASLENRISSAMLASLKNIEANISGLASLIVRGDVGGQLASGVKVGTDTGLIGKGIDAFTGVLSKLTFGISDLLGIGSLGKIIGGLFGSKTKITGQGLTAVPQALESILANGFDLLEFVAIQTKKKSFGITTSTKNSIRTSAANPELENQFSLIFQGFADSVLLAGGPLGVATDEISKRLNGFIVDIGKIDLKGLNGEEIQAKLEAVFGQQADKLANAALPMLAEFQKVGEGYFETVVRVASGIEQASTLLDRLGLSAINYAEILNTQGDVTTEIIRQSVLLTDTSKMVSGGFAEIVGNFQGTGAEITDLVIQLRDMQDALRATGKAGELLTTFMIAGAGGVDRLNAGLSTYFDDFLTDSERAAILTQRVGQSFANIGQVLPQSIEGFRALIAGIDISTEAGQRLYGQVIALAPAFVDLQDAMESAGDASQALRDSLTQAFNDLRQAVQQAQSDLKAAYDRESGALKTLIGVHDTAAKKLREFANSLRGAVESPVQSLARLRAEFASIARAARLGDASAAESLPQAGGALRDAVLANASTSSDAAREIARIRIEAESAAAVQDRQKSIAEIQLDALDESVGELIQVGDNVLSVRDAIDNLRALQTFENKAIADAVAAGFGNLAGANGQSLSAIDRGTTASLAISNGISTLVGLQSAAEAARIAAAAAQQAAIEQAARDKLERERLAKVADLNTQLGGATTGFAQTKATIDDALARIVTLGGNRIANAESNSAANATFARGELGQSISNAAFLDVTGGKNQASRESAANAAAKAKFYGDLSTLQVVQGGLNSTLEGQYNQAQALRQQIISLGGIPAFAKGGEHDGGWRIVGENGPELEYTGASKIYSNAQSSSLMDTSSLEAEVKMLREEMKRGMFAVAKNTQMTSDQLRRWDGDGLPEERVA